jgi:hypothetical protein
VTWEDCNWWVSADARELRRMRLGRLGGLILASLVRDIVPRLTCGEPARQRRSRRVEPEPIGIRLGE